MAQAVRDSLDGATVMVILSPDLNCVFVHSDLVKSYASHRKYFLTMCILAQRINRVA